MSFTQNSGGTVRDHSGGRVLEGRVGLAVAAVLALATIALAVAEWILLPDQVIVQFGISGEHYGPKPLIVLITAALGLGGAGWMAAARAKTGLLLAVIGLAVAVVTLVINLVLF